MTERAATKHYAPSVKEQEALLASPAQTRFEYFVHKVGGWNEAWGLRFDENAWVSVSDPSYSTVFALWPAAAYAERAAIGEWAGAKPAPIALRELLDDLLPAWIANNVGVSVFWLPSGRGILVEPALVQEALLAEAEQYEAGSDEDGPER